MAFSRQPIQIFWILIFLTVSCASPSASIVEETLLPPPKIDPVFFSNGPTPTPFQPQPQDSPDPYSALTTPQVVPTFTPYPTKYVLPNDTSVQVEVIPSAADTHIINNPLTGLPVADPSMLLRRPIAIKIGNSPDYVRPQSGLSLADVAYEYYIEWGDTRFVAVFYGNNPERVGPVRSGRYFDEHITRMYHSFLFFKGADPRELSHFRSLDISDFMIVTGFGNCPPFFTGPYRRDAYNNVFFNPTRWSECAERWGVDNSPQTISGGFFLESAPESALSISRIYSYYSIYNFPFAEMVLTFMNFLPVESRWMMTSQAIPKCGSATQRVA